MFHYGDEMKVKELIKELLNCPMDSDINLQVNGIHEINGLNLEVACVFISGPYTVTIDGI